ncbi:MAG: sigma 54-interacting transcriptional regulator [Deltaproteobacteria bacterium]|jgi:transcriptional regulator with AAA-type ATPase domain/NAD-dependent dihydropyrimidine dehydrogenase PreA subunit|nr:sigma 54-interacting transcriptional regulator [Deltaproteobacteria bacterium]
MKKIGQYFLDNNICDESSLESALKEQAALKEKGVFKPIGSLLAEAGNVSLQDLENILTRMNTDILSSASLLKDISNESIKKTVSFAEHKVFPEKTLVFREGDEPDSFFLITSGEIKITITGPDKSENVLAVLHAGEALGEIPLLTGEKHTTTATTVGSTSLLVLSKEFFQELCSLNPEVSMAFVRGFADRLMQKDAEILKASEKEKAYQQFVSEQDTLSLPELIGQTRTINKLRKSILTAAENDLAVLVQGEAGTEKLVVAGNIHKESVHATAPFLSMDAENVVLEGYGAILDEDSGTLQLEMAQSSVLFGHEDGAFAFSKNRGLGLLQICRQGTVVIENIDKLTKGVQEKLHSYLVEGDFTTVGGQRLISSKARIIGTTSEDIEKLAEEGKFDNKLLELLQANSLKIPPIRKRKSDLRLLVDFIIIMECFKTPDRKLIKGISPEAYQRIMEYDWPGNMDELQIVIRRAINLAKSDHLMPEDIFIGMAPPEGKYTFNLLQLEQVRNLFRHRFYPVGIQALTGAFFSVIFLLAFVGNQSPDANVSLLLVWALWWPMLAISWFFGARIWCSVCPMGAVNDLCNRFCSLKKKVPKFIRNNSIYLSGAGLALIIYVEASSNMVNSPMATGFLLLSIATFAILSGVLYERRVWCRYLCPLGRLAATFSGCSVIEWRSNSSICNSTCKTNACYKGNGEVAGCPLYQGPFSLYTNQDCILCGNCVKICENGSPAFNVRIPGHELWAAIKPEKVTAIFVPVIMGTQIFRGVEHSAMAHALESVIHSRWAAFAFLLLAATAVSFVFARLAGDVSFGQLKNEKINKGELFINCIIPLSFTFEIGYQLKPLLERLGHFLPVFGRQFGFDLEFLDFASGPGAAKPWQVLLILLGIVVAMGFLKVLIKNHQEAPENGSQYKRLRYLPIFFLGIVYIWMFVMG